MVGDLWVGLGRTRTNTRHVSDTCWPPRTPSPPPPGGGGEGSRWPSSLGARLAVVCPVGQVTAQAEEAVLCVSVWVRVGVCVCVCETFAELTYSVRWEG